MKNRSSGNKEAVYSDPSVAHERATKIREFGGGKNVRITPKRGKYIVSWTETEESMRNRSGNFPDMYSGPMKRSSWGVMPSAKEWKAHFTYYVPGGIYPIRNAHELKNRDGDFTSAELRALVKRLSQSPNEERMSLASGIMETLGFEWI